MIENAESQSERETHRESQRGREKENERGMEGGEEMKGGWGMNRSDSTQLYCKIGMTEYFSFR